MNAQRMRRRRRFLFALVAAAVAAPAAACGSRTGLLAPLEVQQDASHDVIHHADAPPPEQDAGDEDALPPIDVVEPVDAFNECPDAGSTLVYLITEQYDLMSFYPPAASFRTIGAIRCPAAGGATPFSMAVDRQGLAYIVYDDGELFNVSTATAACQPTPFRPGSLQDFSNTFGMGFSKDTTGPGETLFIASDEMGSQVSRLGTIDTMTFQIGVVGTFHPQINLAELTGTGAGQLFAFYPLDPANPSTSDTAIGEIDKTTANIIAQSTLPGVSVGSGWAFAFWGGDFYTFTAPGANPTNPSVVTRFRPSDGSITQVASTSETIVGAGVSTCAPQR
jgi:hypothetical protein